MTTRPTRDPLARFRAAELGRDGGPTDGRLLARFADERDEAALGALVRRLGPAVLGVCRRVIGDAHLAEDAFQAVFLVLVRRADRVRPREQVGAWLYGVAYRVARRARAARARRLAREHPMSADHAPAGPAAGPPADDLLPVLDEELARLPEHYRAAVLACDLEGRTRKDAAARLGVPDGTLSNRLAAAHRMLARRLARRGVGLAAGGVATLLSQAPAAARVPPALVGTTARLALGGAGGPASPAASALADAEVKMLLLTKLNGVLAGLVALVAGAALLVALAPAAGDDRPAPVPVAAATSRPVPEPTDLPAPKVIDTDGQSVDWVAFSPDGKHLAARTSVEIRSHGQPQSVRVVKVWDVKTGKVVRTMFEGEGVARAAFSPDGKHLAATVVTFPTRDEIGHVRGASSSKVVVVDAVSGKETARLADSTAVWLQRIVYSPDGKYLAAGGLRGAAGGTPEAGDVAVWDAATGKVLWNNQDHKGPVRELAFSADGKLLATPSDDRTVRVWDSFTGKHQRTLEVKAGRGLCSAAFSPDGTLVAASGADGTAWVWDVATGGEKHVLEGGYMSGRPLFVRFLPDGTLVTAGIVSKEPGIVPQYSCDLMFWDAKTGKMVKALTVPNLWMGSMDASPDGTAVAVAGLRALVIFPLGK